MIFVTDAAGKATFISSEWQEMTGQSHSQAVDFGWVAVLHPDDGETVRKLVLEAIRLRSEFSVRYRVRLLSGEYVWLFAGAVPSFGPPGRTFLGFLGSVEHLATTTFEGVAAYGTLGLFRPRGTLSETKPTSLLELAADHLIMAHSLLVQDGGRAALPALQTTLHQIGLELAKASHGGGDPGPIH